MGACLSSEEERRNAEIDTQLKAFAEYEKKAAKLLFLGAGGSGKSTMFKQMRIIYAEPYTSEELRAFTPIVYRNVIETLGTLLDACHKLGIEVQEKELEAKFREINVDSVVNRHIAKIIQRLWRDKGCKAAYKRRSEFQLNESAKYFSKRLKEVMKDDYVASTEDVLRLRVRTSGMVEEVFVVSGKRFQV